MNRFGLKIYDAEQLERWNSSILFGFRFVTSDDTIFPCVILTSAANLAWRRLSTQVQREVSTILNISNATEVEDFGSPMSVVANWADHVRHFLPWSGTMHFIDVRDDLIEGGCHYQYNSSRTGDNIDSSASSDLCEFQYYHRDCAGGVCAAGAILNYSTKLIEQQHQQQDDHNEGESRLPSSSRHLRQGIVKKQKDRNYHLHVNDDSNSKAVRQALMFLIQ